MMYVFLSRPFLRLDLQAWSDVGSENVYLKDNLQGKKIPEALSNA